jgi:hypothetical protein
VAAIDRPTLVADTKFWLPTSNTLIDSEILALGEFIISTVGDDDTLYPEVLCKSLKACALKNLTDSNASNGAIKKQRIGEHEREFFQGGLESTWKMYIDSLKDICPLFGYSPTATLGMKISPSESFDVLCDTTSDYEPFL